MSLIELTNLEVTIGHKTILKSIDLTIEEGTVTAFVGPSGSGKTTLLRTLNLLQIPTSGRLRVGDTEVIGGKINKRDIRQIRNHSTMVFQQFHLFKNYTILQNVVQPLVLSGRFSRKEAEIIAHESLEKVGLAAFEN
ncbi:ATP-binding cassette domain-containing protein [Streptococcus sp. UBA632]|uniref:ATP-binding cassette domain-containing protein n=1 Tax=Streptococcus TaxID=1301 RepID=UPI0025FB9298|nr:ATP-binding cassette domain-containing protein [Streptococcus sp. UBA632]